jgi:hypothetical protein
MSIRRNLSTTLCWLIAVGFCFFALPANAQTAVTVEQTTSTSETAIVPIAGTTVTTTTIKTTSVKPDLYFTTIDTKRRELLKVIGEGMATGKLTQVQADDLRTELDVITQLELAARKYGDAIPMSQIAVIAARLDVVGQRLNAIYAFPFIPIMSNGRFVVFNGEIIQLDVIAMRRAELEGKISLALAHSTLSRPQVDDLRKQLDNVAVTEVQFRQGAKNGEFTNEQARTLFNAFDRVGSQLDQFIASNKGKPVTGVY